jgi:hypothetical protein
MKQAYKEIDQRRGTMEVIGFINTLIDDYQRQGFTLSVRQLYYQLVARDMIPNTEQSYKRVAKIINDGRLAGLIDWDAIEDRGRDIEVRGRWRSGKSVLLSAAEGFHMDMWQGQEHRVFVIVEKAALAGVLGGVCTQYDVPLLAARGYPSVSILRELALEHIVPAIGDGQVPTILHLGDHDPSGIDMTRDLLERLKLFVEAETGEDANVERIALTMEQIRLKRPPPNPAKVTDSRYDGYRKVFGDKSWELDALEPAFLVSLVTQEIEQRIDALTWQARNDEIEAVRFKLHGVAKRFKA